jgi:hypothetical protein
VVVKVTDDVKIEEVYTTPELINKIASHTDLSPLKVSHLMRYNVFTVAQFVTITELSKDSVNSRLATGSLTKCYPLPRYDGLRESVFILRDNLAIATIQREVT